MPHRRPHRSLSALLAAVLLLTLALAALAPAAMAFTEADTEQDAGEEGEGEEGVESELGIVPVQEAPPPEADDQDAPWTQRFLAPTVLLLGVLGLVGSVLYYGMRVRGRYRVVD